MAVERMKLRLDKYLADMGLGTRSQIKKDISKGQVLVNGTVSKDAGTRIDTEKDQVSYLGQAVTYAEYEYYHGYCKMDKENIPVLYPFGYGLSYTTFDISEPTVEVFDKTAKISVNVKNTGDVKGAEVVQLYIGCEGSAVDRPVKILKDFARVELMPGEEKKVSLQVSSKDMAYYSEEKDDFVEEDITYIAYTGDCSCKEALKSVKFEFGK